MLTPVYAHFEEIQEEFTLTIPENIDHVPAEDILAVYLRQTGHVQLLSAGEEVTLAQRIGAGKYARMVLDENGGAILPERLLAALHELVQDAQLAREALARANIRLVVSIAKYYRESPLPFVDLIQEGNIGLMLAVDRFDSTLGNRFSTYATYWIQQTIRRGITRTSRMIRLPQDVDDRLRQIYAAREVLRQELGREPGIGEVSKRLNIPARKIMRLLTQDHHVSSLNAESSDQAELGDLLEDQQSTSPEDSAETAMRMQAIEQTLNTLSEREAAILRMRFGLCDGIAQTLEEIGETLHLSKERIRQIEAAALDKLRKSGEAKRLFNYFLEE
jgi:RNA polymerase primary sigma factor